MRTILCDQKMLLERLRVAGTSALMALFLSGTIFAADKEPVADILYFSEGSKLSAEFKFIWKGFVIGKSNTSLLLDNKGYDIHADFVTKGPLRLFEKGTSDVRSRGRILKGAVRPEYYLQDGVWGGDSFTTELNYGPEGLLANSRFDWPEKDLEKDNREPVPTNLQTGPDPLSIMVSFMQAPWRLSDDGRSSKNVFDGRAVYEQTLECMPMITPVKSSKHMAYSGTAQECIISFKMKAGFRIETEKEKKRREKRQAKALKKKKSKRKQKDKRMRVWFAPLEGSDLMVPVKARFHSDWGLVKMYMSDFKTSKPLAALYESSSAN